MLRKQLLDLQQERAAVKLELEGAAKRFKSGESSRKDAEDVHAFLCDVDGFNSKREKANNSAHAGWAEQAAANMAGTIELLQVIIHPLVQRYVTLTVNLTRLAKHFL